MKRRFFTLFLVLLTVSALIMSSSADILWEPDDSFYEKHRNNCTYVNRTYELAGYDGSVTVFTAPGGMNKTTLDNGLQVNIYYTWKGKGTTWGYLSPWVTNGDATEGWVPMDDLSLVYDSRQFTEDHAAELTTADPAPVDFQEAVLYRYPHGPALEHSLTERAEYQPFSEVFTQLYTDETGLRWGYIGYYMGSLDAWVCLDDPMNRALDTGIVPVSPSPAQVRGSATVVSGPTTFLIAAGLVAAVVIVTGILILKLKKRDRA